MIEKIYGKMPPRPTHMSYVVDSEDSSYAAGKALLSDYTLFFEFEECPDEIAAIPLKVITPVRDEKRHPVVIYLTDDDLIPSSYLPVEEIIDRGYGIIHLNVNTIYKSTGYNDEKRYKTPLIKFIAGSRKSKSAIGQVGAWAWTLQRIAELTNHLNGCDKIIFCGHGKFARAAMLAAGSSEYAKYVIANAPDASLPTYAENIPQSSDATRYHPELYCPAYASSPFGDEYEALINHCKSKYILIGNGDYLTQDEHSREYGYLCRLCINYHHPAGINGIEIIKTIPTTPCRIEGERMSYHIRHGTNYFTREDWNIYLDYIDKVP